MLNDRKNMQLQAILNASEDMVIIKDSEGHWVEANERAVDIFQIDDYVYKGKSDHQLGEIYEHYRQFVSRFIKMDEKAWETGKQVKTEEKMVIGENEYIFEMIRTPLYNRFGSPDTMMLIGRDITEKRKEYMGLLESEKKYYSFFSENPDGIYSLNMNGHVLDVNKVAEQISGYSRDEWLKLDFLSTIEEEDVSEIKEAFEKVKIGKTESREVGFICKDGMKRQLYLTFIPTSLNGKVISIAVIAQDITDKKQSEFLRQMQTTILEAIAVGKPLQQILQMIVDIVESQANDVFCSIMFYEEEDQLLYIGYAPRLNEILEKTFDKIPVNFNNDFGEHVEYMKGLIITENIETDKHWEGYREEAISYGIRSCWSLPILSTDDSLLGIFALGHKTAKKPTKFEIEMLTSLCYLTGLAIERNKFEENIQYLASHDVLTDLANLRHFKEVAADRIEQAKHSNVKLGILFLDLNEFKSINDTFGHAYGDTILKTIAQRIKRSVTDHDIVSRIGGDEFVILIGHVTSDEQVIDVAETILQAIKNPIMIHNSEFHVTTSIGISVYPDHGQVIEELIRNADTAMYNVKSTGGNTSKIYDETMADLALEYFSLQTEFRKALKQNQFLLHYQPKVNTGTGEVIGVEALVRWNHPEKGLISPAIFIPLAEESGFIMELGVWVIQETCRQIKAWKQLGSFDIRVAVNVSVRQFIQQDVVKLVKDTLRKEGLPPNCLEIEITESVFIKHENIIQDAIANLQEIGIRVSIDDFGTGYASLSYLKQFRANTIKIDRSFIRSLPKMKDDAAIVSTVITLARKLNMDVVAEGVETKEQAEFLLRKGCSDVQGFYYSKPLPPEQLLEFLSQKN